VTPQYLFQRHVQIEDAVRSAVIGNETPKRVPVVAGEPDPFEDQVVAGPQAEADSFCDQGDALPAGYVVLAQPDAAEVVLPCPTFAVRAYR
jgi:hypothetical protein